MIDKDKQRETLARLRSGLALLESIYVDSIKVRAIVDEARHTLGHGYESYSKPSLYKLSDELAGMRGHITELQRNIAATERDLATAEGARE